jgi:hypothetical protein
VGWIKRQSEAAEFKALCYSALLVMAGLAEHKIVNPTARYAKQGLLRAVFGNEANGCMFDVMVPIGDTGKFSE